MSGAAPLVLTLGDPAGVGPEIVAKTWTALRGAGRPFFVVGDAGVIERAGAAVRPIATPDQAAEAFADALPVLHAPCAVAPEAGRPDPANAAAIVGWIETATKACLNGSASGLVTAPIAKAPLYEAGFRFPGHTEFVADLTRDAPVTGARGPVMMLTAQDLRVALVTIHEPLSRVPGLVTTDRVEHAGRVTLEALRRDFGVEAPRLAVLGLNPHAGEGGALGREDLDQILPAIERLRADGWRVDGPKPADTAFHAEARAGYDAVLAMYHDQGLIPVKALDIWGGVNLTLGLPIVRTSPDHGTAFDAAGRGVARPDSLIAAVRLADRIAARRAAA